MFAFTSFFFKDKSQIVFNRCFTVISNTQSVWWGNLPLIIYYYCNFQVNKFDFKGKRFFFLKLITFLKTVYCCAHIIKTFLFAEWFGVFRNRTLNRYFDVSNLRNSEIQKGKVEYFWLQSLFVLLKNKCALTTLEKTRNRCLIYLTWSIRDVVIF